MHCLWAYFGVIRFDSAVGARLNHNAGCWFISGGVEGLAGQWRLEIIIRQGQGYGGERGIRILSYAIFRLAMPSNAL